MGDWNLQEYVSVEVDEVVDLNQGSVVIGIAKGIKTEGGGGSGSQEPGINVHWQWSPSDLITPGAVCAVQLKFTITHSGAPINVVSLPSHVNMPSTVPAVVDRMEVALANSWTTRGIRLRFNMPHDGGQAIEDKCVMAFAKTRNGDVVFAGVVETITEKVLSKNAAHGFSHEWTVVPAPKWQGVPCFFDIALRNAHGCNIGTLQKNGWNCRHAVLAQTPTSMPFSGDIVELDETQLSKLMRALQDKRRFFGSDPVRLLKQYGLTPLSRPFNPNGEAIFEFVQRQSLQRSAELLQAWHEGNVLFCLYCSTQMNSFCIA